MYILSGMVIGFMLCFFLVMRGQNHIEDRLDAIDQKMAASPPAQSIPAPGPTRRTWQEIKAHSPMPGYLEQSSLEAAASVIVITSL